MKLKYLITACILPITFISYAVETEKEKVTNSYSETASSKTSFDENVGEMISFLIPQEHPGKAYLLQSETPSDNWLFIYHDRWGLSNEVKEEAYTLWKDLKNVNVLAIDLYDGKVAKNSGQAMRFLMSSQYNRNISIIKGAIDYVGDEAKIGSLGWSAGGAWSLQTAIYAGEKEVACVVYYGMPEYDVEKLKKIESDVLAIFADMDTWITPGLVNRFEAQMTSAGKELREIEYKGTGGFATKSSDKYNYKNAEHAYSEVLSYLSTRYQ
ncbi:MAG: carboxymethylenebutenolidase [Salibacteraceae bacterium]|jgi:carboxymethylenebutenolidase